MRARLTATAVIVALAGCGGGGDADAARKTVNTWLRAMTARDDASACAQLTSRLQKLIDLQLRQLGHAGKLKCRNYAAHWAFPPSPVGRRDARVESVRLDGSKGTVLLSAPGGLESEVALRKERGRWRLDNYQ